MNMTRPFQTIAALALGAAALFAGFGALPHSAGAHADDANVQQVFSKVLPNVPGKVLSAVVVNYAPGGKSGAHHHSGSVFAYVLSGSIRSQVSGQGEAKVYKAGESFFEPPGSSHLVSENASATEPASLIAIFVADDGATLTAPGAAK
jgi:quercetin dioxygenase-like cupin family protein